MQRLLTLALAGAALLATPLTAAAQDYPSKPITFVVGFAPGGAVDIVGRAMAAQLQEQMGQSIVVENRPGANSNIASVSVARAAPDGYTILVGANGLVNNGALYENAGFDVEKDFLCVGLIAEAPPVIAAGKGFAGSTLKDMIEAAKARPGDLGYGSPGPGSSGHLMMELMQRTVGIKLQHVPYRGGAPAITDALGGHVPLLGVILPEVIGHARAGTLKILGVASKTRSPHLPDAPTIEEQGFPGFAATTWWALFAPAGTPRAVIEKINGEMRKALANPAFREKLNMAGAVPTGSTPEEMTTFIKTERERWSKIIKDANIRGE